MTHRLSNTRLYSIWHNMKSRCYCKYDSKYGNYGGKGITICEEWRNNFQAFYDWAMQNGYEDPPVDSDRFWKSHNALTIDRIDEEQGYCPENCRWISFDLNRRHRRFGRVYCRGHEIKPDNRLEKLRVDAGLSISELSKLTKISQWRIRKAEQGKPMYFPPSECLRLAKALNSTVEKLFN